MSACTTKVLLTTLFFCLIVNGNVQCTLSDLKVSQSQTPFQIHGKPEWVVTITKNCSCSLSDVKLNCKGFQTTESIDPLVLSVSGDICLLDNGNSIPTDGTKFKYAWDNEFPLNPISATTTCS